MGNTFRTSLFKKIPFGKTALVGASGYALYEIAPSEEQAAYLEEIGVPGFMVDALQFMTPDKSKAWLQENVFNEEGLRNLTAQGGDAVGVIAAETAEAAVEGDFAGKFAWFEKIGVILNKFFGGDSFSGFINFFRELAGKEPVILKEGKLVPVSANTDNETVTADMTVTDMSNSEFETAFNNAVEEKGIDPRNISDLRPDELLDLMVAADSEFLDEAAAIKANDGLSAAFARAVEGSAGSVLNAVTDLHQKIRPGTTLSASLG